ncbi:putative PurR-regulated permease PerM [Arcanobacterium wilhelmae]|uniref:PurR-regulated permease PerM n=1 Tax=Arcanobacterium wilhelmae TaxID=1803177 RepID=A0ABT9NAZ5_9ACTO|nr:AI-2E family transporter [Arcanobacterium wilhelmae]MDP9800894.1 putative PurR-regulated permease PerM [Arcanobacterium wilhelmae]WFN90261.1 AI-2E family transporter [Arcanobacterium wilhelmae]
MEKENPFESERASDAVETPAPADAGEAAASEPAEPRSAVSQQPSADAGEEPAQASGQINGLSILAVCAMLVLVGAGLFAIQNVFGPVFLAFTVVLAFRPIGQWLLKKGWPSWLAATAVIVAVVGFILIVVGITVLSLTPLPATLMQYSDNFENIVQTVLQFAQEKGIETQDLSVYLNQLNFNSIVGWAWSLFDYVSSVGGLIMIVVVALIFITVDTMIMSSRNTIMRMSHSHLASALGNFERRVRQYWIISTVFGLIVAVIDAIGMQMLGVPLAWTWGVWAFITNYIPNVGFFIGVVPPMLMALLDQGWQAMVWVAVLYVVSNVVIQNFIQPKFTGDRVGLSTSVTFISLTIWTVVVGWLGSILAVPLTLFFKALLVDSDPRSRWIDAFLISEEEAKSRRREGFYDIDAEVEDEFIEFRNPFGGSENEESAEEPKRDHRRLSGLTRQLKAPRKHINNDK